MDKNQWKTYGLWILLCETVGIVSGLLSREGTEIYNTVAIKPALSPPGWLFPVIWSILFALMGISAARISMLAPSAQRSLGLNLFMTQLMINFFWPLFFFNAMAYSFAFAWLIFLWVIVLIMILIFYKLDKISAWLQLPYLAWLTFAAYLNGSVWILNR